MSQPATSTDEGHVFSVGEYAVHPSHGVGKVIAIEEKSFGGTKSVVYVMTIVGSELKVMVPMTTASMVGLRPVMSTAESEAIFDVLGTPGTAVTSQTWNRRLRAYTEMLSSGEPKEIAKVLRDMHRLKFDKELSFGERRLLDQALALLVEEIALAQNSSRDDVTARIEGLFEAPVL